GHGRVDRDLLLASSHPLVADHAVDLRVQREVRALADVAARRDGFTDLTDQNAASVDLLTAVNLDATKLRVGFAPVACRACAFFVCHGLLRSTRDGGDLHRGETLTMPVLATVALATTKLEHGQLLVQAMIHDLPGDLGFRNRRRPDLRRL